MRTMLAAVVLSLTGCASVGSSDALLQAMENLKHCDRTYTVAVGMGASGTLTIQCKAQPVDAR